jgi:hypothetical protein
MNSEEFMTRVAPVVAEYTTTFCFGEKSLESASRWAVNWLKMGFDADSVCQGIREGMTGQILKKDQIGAHYPHLTDLIRACRRNNYSDKKPEGCELCEKTGYIFVPHPKAIANMQWAPLYHADGLYTIAAWCRCDLGIYRETKETVITKDGVKLKTPTIDYYEDMVCGNWQELMAQRPIILGRNSDARFAELKKNRSVIPSEVRRGPLPERDPVPFTQPMDKVVARVAPQLAPKPATKPKQLPAAPRQQDDGNGMF